MQDEAHARPDATPAALGLAMPAEWERHEATWLGWPKNPNDWPGKFATIPWVFGEIIRKLTPGERVRLFVDNEAQEKKARRLLTKVEADLGQVDFLRVPTNRGWLRDCGPAFARGTVSGQPLVGLVDFGFNAWAKYPDWQEDDLVPSRAAALLGRRMFSAALDGRRVILEGGSIDVNGQGDILTTEECLLDDQVQVRNPGFSRDDYRRVFADYLGADNVIWLGKGIAGDDTHGHVDDLCRFVGPETVVLCREKNPSDANYAVLEENRERLQGVRLKSGAKIEVVELPMPAPLVFDGMRLPASYANFYIANAAVLVPTFNDPNDRIALGVLGELFRERPVVGVHAVDLVWGLGTLHCLSHEEPAA